MILYHGGSWMANLPKHFPEKSFPNGINILDTYAYTKNSITSEKGDIHNIFFDCGAYTAWNQGKTINLQEYINFLQKYKKQFKVYAALDVIGNPKASWQNYKEMKKQGLDPLPAYHQNEDILWLNKYLRKTNYIGLGGMGISSKKGNYLFVKSVFSLFNNPEEVRFHGYGVTDKKLMLSFPWHSTDSTSAMMIGIMGNIFTPWGIFSMSNKSPKQKIFPPVQKNKLKKYLNDENINFDILKDGGNLGYVERIKVNVQILEKLKQQVPKTYEPITNYLI